MLKQKEITIHARFSCRRDELVIFVGADAFCGFEDPASGPDTGTGA